MAKTVRKHAGRLLGEKHFFASPSIKELAFIQMVKPLEKIEALAGALPNDEDVDEFLKEIYSSRA